MKKKIKEYLLQKIGEDVTFLDTDDIFEMGLVNSMFALQLVMYLEKTFAIQVENQDLNLQNFNTVEHIEAFVQRKQLPESTTAASC